ncbi:hypothetical protein CHCC20335_4188 [Bacillus paralicheniformis]|nr:hypothetical protein CHCC20335_4188 [Bacillus paralicheniformis]
MYWLTDGSSVKLNCCAAGIERPGRFLYSIETQSAKDRI